MSLETSSRAVGTEGRQRSRWTRVAVVLTVAVAAPVFLLGCPKKETPVEDAAPPPPPPDPPDAAVIQLGDDDAGDMDAADAHEAGKRWTGPAVPAASVNKGLQDQLKACCAKIAAAGNANTAEGFYAKSVASSCFALASQNSPEGNALRSAAISIQAMAAQAKVAGCL